MALSDQVKRALSYACAAHGTGAAVATAIDANTLKTSFSASAAVVLNTAKTSMPTCAVVTATSTTATTTWLKSRVAAVITSLQAKSHMAS